MKIAHISDLHLLALDGVPRRRFLNKRLTGWVNLRLKRERAHRAHYVAAIARELAGRDIDHVIVTGDLTNLALEGEYELARGTLREMRLDPSCVTVVPGNHDLYTRGARDSRRFERYMGEWLESDLPQYTVDTAGARFPVVKLRGDIAIVALSSAVPRMPLVAAGEIGKNQLRALEQILEHPEVVKRALVIALHHPVVQDVSRFKNHIEGLRDAADLLRVLRSVTRGLIVHGHLHRRVQRPIGSPTGRLVQVGTTSASLHHDSRDRMAGFNVYELDRAGAVKVEGHVYDPGTESFYVERVPTHVPKHEPKSLV
jgi:3',5'-cyclic AMP phosphodiesterase CpdA